MIQVITLVLVFQQSFLETALSYGNNNNNNQSNKIR